MRTSRGTLMMLVTTAIIVVLSVVPYSLSSYYVNIAIFFFLYSSIALSYDILGGQMGYLNLGHAIYYGLGAYAFAIIVNTLYPLSPSPVAGLALIAVSFIASGLITGAIGWLLGYPLFRLRGFYFAIATLGLISFVNLVVSSSELSWLTGGFTGISLLQEIRLLNRLDNSYFVSLAVFLTNVLVYHRIIKSKLSLALNSIKEDEEVAESSGVNTSKYKLIAMTLSALLAGYAGAAYMWFQTHTNPRFVFSLELAFLPITMALIGGTGTLLGPIVGSAIFTIVYQALLTSLPAFTRLVMGLVLLSIGLATPGGLIGLLRRWSRALGRIV